MATEHVVKLMAGDDLMADALVEAPAHLLVKYSGLIKGMCDEDGELPEMVPLPNVKGARLRQALSVMAMAHAKPMGEIKRPLVENSLAKSMDHPELVAYADALSTNETMELMMLANYIDFSDLLHLMAAKLATGMKGLTPAQIREKYGIENDFTPEQEAAIAEENRWCDV